MPCFASVGAKGCHPEAIVIQHRERHFKIILQVQSRRLLVFSAVGFGPWKVKLDKNYTCMYETVCVHRQLMNLFSELVKHH